MAYRTPQGPFHPDVPKLALRSGGYDWAAYWLGPCM